MKDSTQRFSDRVDNYIKYRPSYPAEIVKLLKEKCGLTEKTVIADIGSGRVKGTGYFKPRHRLTPKLKTTEDHAQKTLST